MTIDQAIRQLKEIHNELSIPGREKDWSALSLGIEALIFCQRIEKLADDTHLRLFPSETIEPPPD